MFLSSDEFVLMIISNLTGALKIILENLRPTVIRS